jgi:lysophospholipase L1-like esterase
MTDLNVADFLRGNAFAGNDEVPYPRADLRDRARLPADTWWAAQVPAGVRLEIEGDATAIEVDYTCLTDDLGPRGVGAGTAFAVWQGDRRLDAVDARGRESVVLHVLDAEPGVALWVHMPEGLKPRVLALRGCNGEIRPAPAGPRWIAYGDSITEGWVASAPGLAWPAITARRHGLDLLNLGYAGAARGELVSAEEIAGLSADVISIFYGTNCWNRTPFSVDMLRVGLKQFLRVVRAAHPRTPIIVVSMIQRPDAEQTPNEHGATMRDLRLVIEDVVTQQSDLNLTLLRGGDLIRDDQLPDGIHPGDEGQWALAEAVGGAVMAALHPERARA